jgi:hypothetical protein
LRALRAPVAEEDMLIKGLRLQVSGERRSDLRPDACCLMV